MIVVGDFNSDPDDPVVDDIVPPYLQFAWAGYVDAWAAKRGRARPGDTCCHAELLDNPEPQLNRRIDLIWARNTANGHGPPIGPIQAVVVGEEVRDLTSSGRWPSFTRKSPNAEPRAASARCPQHDLGLAIDETHHMLHDLLKLAYVELPGGNASSAPYSPAQRSSASVPGSKLH